MRHGKGDVDSQVLCVLNKIGKPPSHLIFLERSLACALVLTSISMRDDAHAAGVFSSKQGPIVVAVTGSCQVRDLFLSSRWRKELYTHLKD